MNTRKRFAWLVWMVLLFPAALPGRAESPREELKKCVADLQDYPKDQILRAKIIKLARGMKSKPPLPDEVDEILGRATHIFKAAKSQEEFAEAVEAFRKVTLLAPWVGGYYYNLGVAQEKAGQLQDAVDSFKFYLLASPNAKDVKAVRARVGGLKYDAEKKKKFEEFEDVWCTEGIPSERSWHMVISRNSDGTYAIKFLDNKFFNKDGVLAKDNVFEKVRVEGKNIQYRAIYHPEWLDNGHPIYMSEYNLTLTEDGKLSGPAKDYFHWKLADHCPIEGIKRTFVRCK